MAKQNRFPKDLERTWTEQAATVTIYNSNSWLVLWPIHILEIA